MTATPHLALPLIAAAQAQKHVTHNEALWALDALVQLAVIDRDRAAPPSSPAEGDRYIVGPGATGAFAGKTGQVALWQEGAWTFFAPSRGWLAYVLAEGALLAWSGSAWIDALAAIQAFQNLTRLGLGATADAANPFSAKLNNALWAAKPAGEGGTGDLRSTFSKESAARVLSLLFQSSFSGRAELGLVGDDDFRLKVSPDGAAWKDAFRVDRTTGAVSFPSGLATPVGLRNLVINGGFQVNQRGYASGAALAAGAYGHDRWKAGAGGGAYSFTATKPDTIITMTAGSLVQIVEDINVAGGAYTLSWTGTAQGRVGAGAYAASPVTVTGLAAGTAITVEFGAGTLGRVQLEPGAVATPFERRLIGFELASCQRYFCTRRLGLQPPVAGLLLCHYHFPVEMRAVPTCANLVPGTLTNATVNNDFFDASTQGGCVQINVTASPGAVTGRVNGYSAEL